MLWSWLRRRRPGQDVITRTPGRSVRLPDGGEVRVALQVNCLGASCPRPQMLALKASQALQEGEVMELVSDNPASVESLAALALVLDVRCLGTVRDGAAWRVYLGRLPGQAAEARRAG